MYSYSTLSGLLREIKKTSRRRLVFISLRHGPSQVCWWPPTERKRGGKDARRVVHGERMRFLVHSKSRASARTVILLSREYMYILVVEIVEARGWFASMAKGREFSPLRKNGNDVVPLLSEKRWLQRLRARFKLEPAWNFVCKLCDLCEEERGKRIISVAYISYFLRYAWSVGDRDRFKLASWPVEREMRKKRVKGKRTFSRYLIVVTIVVYFLEKSFQGNGMYRVYWKNTW